MFRRAVRFAGSFAFERRGELAYFAKTADTEMAQPAQEPTSGESNGAFHRLFNEISLTLAYAYHTPGTAATANPYHQNSRVLQLYLSVLDYAYSRGLTENAWLPDHAGNASVEALEQGLVRTSGDFSEVSLRLAAYIQSIFLMRNELAAANLLAKYRAVVRNLVVNCGVMYGAFFQAAREETGVSHADPLPVERQALYSAPAKESGSVIGPRRTSLRTLRRRNRTQSLSCCSYRTASERLPTTQYHTSSGRLPAVDFVFPSQCSRIRRRKSRVWPTYIRGLPSSFRI